MTLKVLEGIMYMKWFLQIMYNFQPDKALKDGLAYMNTRILESASSNSFHV